MTEVTSFRYPVGFHSWKLCLQNREGACQLARRVVAQALPVIVVRHLLAGSHTCSSLSSTATSVDNAIFVQNLHEAVTF